MRPLLAALALLPLSGFLAAAAAEDRKPERSFDELACADDSPGVLVRYNAADSVDSAAFDGLGLSLFGPQPKAQPEGVKKKGAPEQQPPKPRTYRIKSGEGCLKSLGKLKSYATGDKGDRIELTRGSDDPAAAGDDKKWATFSQLSKVKAQTPDQLNKLWDNLNAKGTFGEIASSIPGISLAAGPDSDAVLGVPPGYKKPDPSGLKSEDFRPKQHAPPKEEPPEPNPDEYTSEGPSDAGTYPAYDPRGWLGSSPASSSGLDIPAANPAGTPSDQYRGGSTPMDGNHTSGDVWKPFYEKFKKCTKEQLKMDCEPANWNIWRKDQGSCHAVGKAVDVFAMKCGGTVHTALQNGKFAEMVSCVKGQGMFVIWHQCFKNCSPPNKTNYHMDHGHFSIGCGWGRK